MFTVIALILVFPLHAAGYWLIRRRVGVSLPTAQHSLLPCWALFAAPAAPLKFKRSLARLALFDALWGYGVLVFFALGLELSIGLSTGTSFMRVTGSVAGYPAEGRFEVGDVILKIDGQDAAASRAGSPMPMVSSRVLSTDPMTFEVLRNDESRIVRVSPRQENGRYSLGIRLERLVDTRDTSLAPLVALALPWRALAAEFAKQQRAYFGGTREFEVRGPIALGLIRSPLSSAATRFYDQAMELMLWAMVVVLFNLLLALWLALVPRTAERRVA